MKKKLCLFVTVVLTFLFVAYSSANGQTVDELNTRIKQLEAENRSLDTKLKKLQKGKSKSAAEAEETIRQLQEENDELWAEIGGYKQAEKDQQEAEENAKSIKISIKDPVFLEYLLRYCDMDNDGILTLWDAEHTYIIDIAKDKSLLKKLDNSKEINNLDGIEHFVNLKRLVCTGNAIPQIDVSKNINLESLVANGCELKLLDVSKNDKLVHLECSNNLLYTINLENNPNLLNIDVSKNKMAAIDLSRCNKLKSVNCSDNTLATLDISQNVELQSLDCSNNQITVLSFVSNTSLSNINCSNNKLTHFDLQNGIDIDYLDCSKNKSLEFVYLSRGHRVISDKKDLKTYYKVKPLGEN